MKQWIKNCSLFLFDLVALRLTDSDAEDIYLIGGAYGDMYGGNKENADILKLSDNVQGGYSQ